MNKVTNIGIYNYEKTKLCDLYDSQGDIRGQAYNISWTKANDGLNTLSFTIPYKVDGEKNFRWQYMRSEYLIRMERGGKIEWFIASKPARSKSGKEIVGNVTCNSFAAVLKTKNIYQTFDDENGIGTIDYLLDQILTGTGWSLGYCDTMLEEDGVTEMVRSLKSDGKKGSLGLINTVCNLFKAYPQYDTDQMLVNIYALTRHDNAIEIEVGRNTDSIQISDNSEDIVTRLYVEGEYGDNGYVGIDDVNPTGLSYIFNFDYYREIGIFGQTHEDALETYLTDALAVKNLIMANQQTLNGIENQANSLVGQCQIALYYTADGFVTPKYTYGNPTATSAALAIGDEVVVLNSNGTHRYEVIETTPQALIQSGDYGIAKFVTKAAGSIGAKEVQIEAKEQEIDNLERKIASTTKADKIAEYNAEIARLRTEINMIKTDENGLYAQMYSMMKSDGVLYSIHYYQQVYTALVAQQLDIEATFAAAMGNLLRDGYWQDNNYIPGQEQALYNDACIMSRQMGRPKTSYTLKYLRTPTDVDTDIDDILINDIAHIIDDELDINELLYVRKITIGIDHEDSGSLDVNNNEVALSANDLGSVLSRMSELSDLIDQKNALYERAKAISASGSIYTDRLNGQIDVLKIRLLSTVSNWYTDDNGNIMFLSADGGSAMMLSGAGFMIASAKDDNGEWIWRTFGTGEGFTADEIVAGFISAERIEAGSIETSHLAPTVGSTLVISGNPSITQLQDAVAPEFSTSESYVTGDLVMKDGIVYIFTQNHPAGAWNSNHVQATNISTQIELMPDKIIQYVAQQGYGRTFISLTDPALDAGNNVQPGDYWVKRDPDTGTWGKVKNKTWGQVKNGTWYDIMNKMADMYCRKGEGANAEWIPVNDTSVLTEAYTRIEQTSFAIIQEAHRANAAEGELDSKIVQTAEGILQTVSRGYIAQTSVYQTADQIVTKAEQYTASQLTNYYTKTETASKITTEMVSYTYSKADVYTKSQVYTKSDVYTKTETASQITTSLSSYTYSKADVYTKSDVYTKTETASLISTTMTSYTYSKADVYTKSDVYTKTETASKITTEMTTYTYSKGDLYTKSDVYKKTDVYTKTETSSLVSTSISSYTYSKTDVYTKTETASQITTSITSSLGNYYTKTETASEISTYVGNNAYGKVSGITINSNGVTITGDKYISLTSSGYITIGNFKFTERGMTLTSSDGTKFRFGTNVNNDPEVVCGYGVGTDTHTQGGETRYVKYATIKGTYYEGAIGSSTSHSNSLIWEFFPFDDKWILMHNAGTTENCSLGIDLSGYWWDYAYLLEVHYDSLIQRSSRSVKHDIQPMKDYGSQIDQLQTVSFVYNDDKHSKTRYGLIYEDTIDIMPEICVESGDSKAINYVDLIPMLLKEIQNLRKRVSELENK